jgi:DNA polymerase-3 subunit gamma/tau
LRGDISIILNTLDDSYNRGHDLKKLYTNCLEHFRNLIVVKMGQNINKLVDLPQYELDQMVEQTRQVSVVALNQIFDHLYREEVSIRLSADTKLALEMAFIRMDQIKPALPIDALIDKLDHLRQEFYNPPEIERSDRKSDVKPEMPMPKPDAEKVPPDSPADPVPSSPKTPATTGDESKNLAVTWDQLYEIIAQKNPSLGASLSKCRLKQVTADSIEIEVRANGFTLNMLQREKNKAALKEICAEYFRKDIDVVLTCHPVTDIGGPKKKSQNDTRLKQKALSHPLVADAIEIFNGKLIDIKLE